MSSAPYYDRDGKPLTDVLVWAQLMGDQNYRRVAMTKVGGYRVSTIWLGIDHSFSANGPPLIFETMVFGAGLLDQTCERYSTIEQAKAGHVFLVEACRRNPCNKNFISSESISRVCAAIWSFTHSAVSRIRAIFSRTL